MAREAERLEREAQAAREAEELRHAAETAKRRHACLLMYKADEESRLWNENWKMQEHTAKVSVSLWLQIATLVHHCQRRQLSGSCTNPRHRCIV